MLKRTERIKRHDFGRVAAGRVVHTPLFTLKLLPVVPTDTGSGQFSVVVSKKVAKTAVARNSLRRKVYAAIQDSNPNSTHGILYMKPESMSASYEYLQAAIRQVLSVG